MNVGCITDPVVPLPQKTWWYLTGVLALKGQAEERFILLKLPSWGFEQSIHRDSPQWMQRMLVYRGHRGLSLGWVPA